MACCEGSHAFVEIFRRSLKSPSIVRFGTSLQNKRVLDWCVADNHWNENFGCSVPLNFPNMRKKKSYIVCNQCNPTVSNLVWLGAEGWGRSRAQHRGLQKSDSQPPGIQTFVCHEYRQKWLIRWDNAWALSTICYVSQPRNLIPGWIYAYKNCRRRGQRIGILAGIQS